MNTLYWLVTITNRHSTDAFLALYEAHGITVSLRTVGAGTAVRETLSTLGLEQTEKAVLFAMITAETWPGLQKDLRRKQPQGLLHPSCDNARQGGPWTFPHKLR